jgi:hypothetical protein
MSLHEAGGASESGYDFYSSQEHYDDLINDVANTGPGDRVVVASMALDPSDPNVADLLPELSGSARRGADVTLAVDAYSFLFDREDRPVGPLVYKSFATSDTRPYFRQKNEAIHTLRDDGVYVGITNMPIRRIIPPYAGRSHIKGTVVNDKWRVGGSNLQTTDNADVMVGREDTKGANLLHGILTDMAYKGNIRRVLGDEDQAFRLDDTTELVFDVGRRNQSAIYERAQGIMTGAEEWLVMTCQYFPGGQTAKLLGRALQNDVETHAFFNADHNRLGGFAMGLLRKKESLVLPPELFEDELDPETAYIHAKIAASETQGMVTSHNLIRMGVLLGTAEVALHSTDPAFALDAGRMALRCAGKADDARFSFLLR